MPPFDIDGGFPAAGAALGPDPEFEDVYSALSLADDGPGGVSRRRFLQGLLLAGGASALTFGPIGRGVRALTPLGLHDGIVVVIMLGGGNDGLNTVIPIGDPRYKVLRPTIAIKPTEALTIAGSGPSATALHPSLAKLKARYAAGKVAIVRGVGKPDGDHSHFTSMATWMAGTSGAARTSGWLGRYVDSLADGDDGLRAVAIGTSVPLHMVGTRAQVTSIPIEGAPFGASRADTWENPLFDAVAAYGNASTGRGRWADALAQADKAAIDRAGVVAPLYPPPTELTGDLTPQLDLAARLINLNLGVRVITTTLGSFDQHDDELYAHGRLLADLDAGIDRFYKVLQAKWGDQVTLVTFSEFGRRAEQNASNGTDHGTASVMFVVGNQVKGGLYGTQPSLAVGGADGLDDRGDLRVPVDFRRVYRSILSGWLGADHASILGGTYADLGLFSALPGDTVPPPPPPPDLRWLPFVSPAALVQQQYLDLLDRAADGPGTAFWAGRLTSGAYSITRLVRAFLDSKEFGEVVRPAGRVALAGLGGIPPYAEFVAWIAMLRAGQPLVEVAKQVVARTEWTSRYGSMTATQLVPALWSDVVGSTVPSGFRTTWVGALEGATKTKADLLVAVAESDANAAVAKAPVDVLMIYVGMLRRSPDVGGYDYWTDRAARGAGLDTLIANFFRSAEYAARFD